MPNKSKQTAEHPLDCQCGNHEAHKAEQTAEPRFLICMKCGKKLNLERQKHDCHGIAPLILVDVDEEPMNCAKCKAQIQQELIEKIEKNSSVTTWMNPEQRHMDESWWQRFKERHGVNKEVKHGESKEHKG